MAEKILETKVCQVCGAEVRPNTLFCYNCGSAVSGTAFPTVREKLLEEEPVNQPIPRPTATERRERPADLKPASAQQKPKVSPNQPVEIIWDEPASAPSIWFLVVALLLTVFAVVILLLMLRIR